MKISCVVSSLAVLACCLIESSHALKYEFTHSLKGPFLSHKNNEVRFWNLKDVAQANSDAIRVAPSVIDRRGAIWNKYPTTFTNWEVIVEVEISGKTHIGADGMAIWYTDQEQKIGRVYGSADNWKGLAIVLDTYNNDDKGFESHISGHFNDGSKMYNMDDDGLAQEFGSCDNKSLRNTLKPVRLKIQYDDNTIIVSTDVTHSGIYEVCFEGKNIALSKGGYFGVSAATGGLADDHDLMRFETFSYPELGQESGDNTEEEITEEMVMQRIKYREEMSRLVKDNIKYDSHDVDSVILEANGNQQQTLQALIDRQKQILDMIFNSELSVMQTIEGAQTDVASRALERKLNEIIDQVGSGSNAGKGSKSSRGTQQNADLEVKRSEAKLSSVLQRVNNLEQKFQSEGVKNLEKPQEKRIPGLPKPGKDRRNRRNFNNKRTKTISKGTGFFGWIGPAFTFLILQVVIIAIFFGVKGSEEKRNRF